MNAPRLAMGLLFLAATLQAASTTANEDLVLDVEHARALASSKGPEEYSTTIEVLSSESGNHRREWVESGLGRVSSAAARKYQYDDGTFEVFNSLQYGTTPAYDQEYAQRFRLNQGGGLTYVELCVLRHSERGAHDRLPLRLNLYLDSAGVPGRNVGTYDVAVTERQRQTGRCHTVRLASNDTRVESGLIWVGVSWRSSTGMFLGVDENGPGGGLQRVRARRTSSSQSSRWLDYRTINEDAKALGIRIGVDHSRSNPEPPPAGCTPTEPALRFDGGYEVSMCYRTPDGRVGQARSGIWSSGEAGLLWFFNQENAEVLVKVLNGCSHNGYRWVFVAPVTTLEFNLRVTAPNGRRWFHTNRQGVTAAAKSDTTAFDCSDERRGGLTASDQVAERDPANGGTSAAGERFPSRSIARSSVCTPTQPALRFDGGYEVSMCYRTPDGQVGQAKSGIWSSPEAGLLWFFNRGNAEVLVKVLNGCSHNGYRWVFVAPVTTLEFDLWVTAPNGRRWSHTNRQGVTASTKSDIKAFDCSDEPRGVADLVVESPRSTESSVAPGSTFRFGATVRNQGTGPSDATTLRYFRSTDSSIDTSDTPVGTDPIGILSPSATDRQAIGQRAPSTPRTYYYGACVDPVAGESNTANNCSSGVSVTVDEPLTENVEVRVSVFGGGTVEVVGDGELDCPVAKLCAGSFPATGSLTLRAVAPSGYAFDHWQGCTSVSGADCVVPLDADRLVSVDFTSTQPLTLKEDVVSFDENRLTEIQEYDPDSGLMVLAADAKIDDIGVGSVLVSSVIESDLDFESYFLRRVTERRQLSGSPSYLRTTHATFEDLIAAGSLAVRGALGPEAVTAYALPPGLAPISHRASDLTARDLPDGRRAFEVSRQVEPPGATAITSSSDPASDGPRAVAQPIELDVTAEIADGVKVTGTIGLTVEPSFMLDAGVFRGLQEFKGQVTVGSRAELGVEANVLNREYRHRLDKLEITFGAITAGPVVIVPSLAGNLFLKVSLKAGVKPVVTLEVEATAGAHYVRGEGWSGIWEFDPRSAVDLPDEIEERATVEVGVVVDLKTKVYGVVGPVIGVGPYLGVSAFTLDPPRGSCRWDYEAYVGGRAEYGGELKVLRWGWEYKATLWDGRLTTPLGRDCPEGGVSPPAPPGRLRFPSTTTDSIAVEWDSSPETGGDYAVTYEVVRSYDPGRGPDRIERKLLTAADTRFTDTLLFPGAEYCYEVRTVVAGGVKSSLSGQYCERTNSLDVAPPSAPLGLTAEARSSGVIALSWSESTDDDRVNHYVIVDVTDGTGYDQAVHIGSTESLGHNVTGLNPNTRYCFGVIAVDDAGNTSIFAKTACASTFGSSEATWRFRIACTGRDYQVEGLVDLDENFVSVVSVVGEGSDYDGDRLTYALTGPYDSTTRVFDGKIVWTFEGSTNTRTDTFKADLSLNDTGDIAMSRSGGSCDAVIRFDRRSSAGSVLLGHRAEDVGRSGLPGDFGFATLGRK